MNPTIIGIGFMVSGISKEKKISQTTNKQSVKI